MNSDKVNVVMEDSQVGVETVSEFRQINVVMEDSEDGVETVSEFRQSKRCNGRLTGWC